MKKAALRNLYKEKRRQLSLSQQERMNDLMLIQFQQLPVDIPALIMSYAPIEKFNEFDPQLVTAYCGFKNPALQLAYPVMTELAGIPGLQPVLADEDTFFEKNKYGIGEPIDGTAILPASIELVIVPMLCFDRMGNRVGYGKGFYDRFLKQCSNNCIKIMFSYFEAVDTIEDIDEYDVKMDYCITPATIYQFH